MVWWTPTTMTSQTGGRLRAFKFYSHLSPVSDLENNLFLKFSFSMFQTLTTALFAGPITFISYLFYFWYNFWRGSYNIRSLSNTYLFLPFETKKSSQRFEMKTKKQKNEDVLCPFVSFRESPQPGSEAYHFIISPRLFAMSIVPYPWKRRRKSHLYWTTGRIFTSRFQYALRNFFLYRNEHVYWRVECIFIKKFDEKMHTFLSNPTWLNFELISLSKNFKSFLAQKKSLTSKLYSEDLRVYFYRTFFFHNFNILIYSNRFI